MDMENLIKNNKDKFMAQLPAGHQKRFAMKLQSHNAQNRKGTILHKRKYIWIGIPSTAAALLLLLFLINKQDLVQPYIYNYSENDKVAEMRMIYETQLNETIALLENVLENVDDSTRNEINKAIENISSTTELLSEIAPLPEEKQLAITSQVYKNKVETINMIYKKLNIIERK